MGLCKDKKMNLPEAGGKNTKMNLPEAGGMSSTAPGCFLLHSLLHQQVFAFSGPKKVQQNLYFIYITFKVTCIKCTKSTFLLMEWPFDNEVISDITAGEKGGISSSFSPFLQTQ